MKRSLVIVAFLFCSIYGEASLIRTTIDTTNGIAVVDSLNGEVLKNEYVDAQLARELVQHSILLATQIKYQAGLADALLYDGYLSDDKGDYYASLASFNKAIVIVEEAEDTVRIAKLNNNFGIVYFHLGRFDIALKHFYKALELQEIYIKDSVRISRINTNIGSILVKLDDQRGALERFGASLKFYRAKGYRQQESVVLANMAVSYTTLFEYDQALNVLNEALVINIELDNMYSKGITLVNLAGVNFELGKVEVALGHHEEALDIFKEIGDQYQIVNTIKNIAVCYSRIGRVIEAEERINQAIELAIKHSVLNLLKEGYAHQSDIYLLRNRYQDALNAYKLYTGIKDSIFNEDKSKEIGKVEAAYDFEKQESEKRIAEKADWEEMLAEKTRSNNLQYSGILIFLVLLGVGLMGVGKLSLPVRLAEGLVFFTFLLFFEFLLVLLDPYIESYSGGAPAYKLLFNAVLAGMIFPLHAFFEKKIKSRLAN